MDAITTADKYDLVANPVYFVLASEVDFQSNLKKSQKFSEGQLSGEQAKKIYENILNEEVENPLALDKLSQDQKQPTQGNISSSRVRKRRLKRSRQVSQHLTERDLFRAAQDGDLETLKNCITNEKLSINLVDAFSWTPLMMAAHGGHEDVVLFLLTEGAEWFEQIDGSGYDARDLACLGGHWGIAEILMNSEKHVSRIKVERCKKDILRTMKREKMWCEICKCHYFAPAKGSNRDPHFSSTLHLVSDKESRPPCQSHFYIPTSNRGYQLLRKDGWDGESGLGPGSVGQKYPVKTILKRDRLGLGAGKSKARVTHFAAYDKKAIKKRVEGGISGITEQTSKSYRKRNRVLEERKDKQKDIDFRRLFY